MTSKRNRRKFLKLGGGVISGLLTAGPALLSGCASIDEKFLLSADTDQTIAVIGGGIGALSLCHQLKKNKNKFVLFESSNRLGGKIFRTEKSEWGAFEFQNTDTQFKKLCVDLDVPLKALDSESWVIENGTTQLLKRIEEKNFTLLSHRQLKFEHELVRIESKSKANVRLVFKNKNGLVTMDFKHVVFCLPAAVLKTIDGIDELSRDLPILKEILKSQVQHTVRVVIPQKVLSKTNRLKTEFSDNRTVLLRILGGQALFTIYSTNARPLRELKEIETLLTKNFSAFFRSDFKIKPEQIFDWTSYHHSQAGQLVLNSNQGFKTSIVNASTSLHLICDSFGFQGARIENVISQSLKTSNLLQLIMA